YPVNLVSIGRSEDGIREGRRILDVDPLSVNALTAFGQALYAARQYEEANSLFMRALEIDPGFPTARAFVAWIILARNEFVEAADYYEREFPVTDHAHFLSLKGFFYGMAGRKGDALRVLDQLKERGRHSYVCPFFFARVYQGLGDSESWKDAMQ